MGNPQHSISLGWWLSLAALMTWLVACFPAPLSCDEKPAMSWCSMDSSSGEIDGTSAPSDTHDDAPGETSDAHDSADAITDATLNELDADAAVCHEDDECQDQDLCNGLERCVDGACREGTPVDCGTAAGPCQARECDPSSGACVLSSEQPGCDDSDACTINDRCENGTCIGTARACPPIDDCHAEGTCSPLTGECSEPPLGDGHSCLAGTDEGSCESGICQPYPVVVAGGYHACAVRTTSAGVQRVKCWGAGLSGVLGRGSELSLGESPANTVAAAPDIDTRGEKMLHVAAAFGRTCVVADGSAAVVAKCWGSGLYGALGTGATAPLLAYPTDGIQLGEGHIPTETSASDTHTCAVLSSGLGMCWGFNLHGGLGYGHTDNVGDVDTRLPAHEGPIPMGDIAIQQLVASNASTCALLEGGRVRCWGKNTRGQLGYGDTSARGGTPATTPSQLPFVALHESSSVYAVRLAAGFEHFCALLSNARVICWGNNEQGQLGQNAGDEIGDDERPDELPPIDVGLPDTALAVSAGGANTCVVVSDASKRRVRCFGDNTAGQLGLGNTESQSLQDASSIPLVDLGGDVQSVSVGGSFMCAVMRTGDVRCWGVNSSGQLGIGSKESIGDEILEMPPENTVIFGE